MTLIDATYYLNQSIDCTSFGFLFGLTGVFRGTFDGRGYTISNYSSQGPMFSNGQNAIIKNITFLDFFVCLCSDNAGLLFGGCNNCTIDGIIFNTTDASKTNEIKLFDNHMNIGGLAGSVSDSIIRNSIIQNTYIHGLDDLINVGGIVGSSQSSTITNCHNVGFPLNISRAIVSGLRNVGGLVGSSLGVTGTNNFIYQSGVSNGVIFGGEINVGGLVGAGNILDFNMTYVKSSVIVFAINATNVGGIIGNYITNSSRLSLSYSKAKLTGNFATGGLIGILTNNMTVDFCYFSGTVSSNNNGAGIIGYMNPTNASFTNTYTTVSPIYNGVNINSNVPVNSTCGFVYLQIISNFNNFYNVWLGDNLIIEFPSSYGDCNCSDCISTPPSTTSPSTITPSTITPSTITPSTITPSTLIPSTTEPSITESPSTSLSSTIFPSTLIPSTNQPSSTIPTTTNPSTFSPVNCLYNVPNCQNCGNQGLSIDKSQYNISCILNGNKWAYSYTPLFSNTTITISQSFTLNGTGLIIQGNTNISSTVNLVIVISNLNSLNTDNGAINVIGCINFDGNITLDLSERPQNGNITIVLIRYDCNDNKKENFKNNNNETKIEASQFSVKPTYKNNKCDKIESTINNQQGTISVVLSTKQNSRCSKLSRGAVAGIVIGVVGFTVLVISIGAFYIWKRNSDFDKKFDVKMKEIGKK